MQGPSDAELYSILPDPEQPDKVAERCLKLGEQASKGKVRPSSGLHWHQIWRENWRRYKGHHYDRQEEPGNQISINLLRPTVTQSAATLGATPPGFVIEPSEKSDIVDANIQQMLFDAAVNEPAMVADYGETCIWLRLCGAACGFVDWDPELKRGFGDVALRFLDPRFSFPDPQARRRSEMTYWIGAFPMAVAKARRLWPEFADRIIPHPAWDATSTPGGRNVQEFQGADANFFVQFSAARAQGGAGESRNVHGQCLLMNCVYHPDLAGGEWRQVLVINGQVVVRDGPWDVQDFPVVFFTNERDPDCIWSDGMAIDAKPIEQLIERRHNQIADHHDAQMIGVLFVPYNVLDMQTIERLSNLPYEIVPYDPVVGFKPELAQPVPISADFFRILDVGRDLWEFVTGNTQVLRGMVPVGAATEGEMLIRHEAAAAPLSPVRRANQPEWETAGRLLLRMMQLRYQASRIARVVGSASRVEPDFWTRAGFSPEQAEEMPQQGPAWVYLYMGDGGVPPKGPRIIPFTRDRFLAEYDVKVGAGSDLPSSHSAKYARARDVYGLNPSPVMFRAVLENSGLPEWEFYWDQIKAEIAQSRAQIPQPGSPGYVPSLAPPATARAFFGPPEGPGGA